MARVGSIVALHLLCCNEIRYGARTFSFNSTHLVVALVELAALGGLNHQLLPTGLIWMVESICSFRQPEAMEVVEVQ